MKIHHLLPLLLLPLVTPHCTAQIAVGKWHDHLSYSSTNKVLQANNQIWCSANGGLFYYDMDDMTVNRVNKTTGLTDVGISTFNYDDLTKTTVIAYTNSNIDLLKQGKTVNISDIKRSNIGGNKNINAISFFNRHAYLACGFGIVVIDLSREEIKETYYLGDNGTALNVNDVIFTDSLIVAATDYGLMWASKFNTNLHLPQSWTNDTLSLLAGQRIVHLATDSHNALLALSLNPDSDTSLYNEVSPFVFAPLLSGTITNFHCCNSNTIVCLDNHLRIYDGSYNVVSDIYSADWLDMGANDAIIASDGMLWMAHRWASLAMTSPYDTSSAHSFSPGGPWSDDLFRITSFDSSLFVSPGGHTTTFSNSGIAANVYTLQRGQWRTLQDPDGLLNPLSDILDVAVNPRNTKTQLAASWGGGIVEITGNKVTNVFTEVNTDGVLSPYSEGDFTSLRTGSITYDIQGNAWITNSKKPDALAVKRANGSWQSFDTRNMVGNSDINHILWDSIGDLKIFWGNANRIYIHDGNDKMAFINPNNGSRLQTSSVNCLVQDQGGNLWLGTNKGIKVIYNLSSAFQNGGNGEMAPIACNNIIFNANGITEYLMAYESVTCIAVDGANRKWVGTASGGLYLISANGLEEIQHFTSANSPLFSDKITKHFK